MRLKEAVLACFREPASTVAERLREFTEEDWRKNLYWLDVSGLALYCFDRLALLGVEHCLPVSIQDRLKRNLADNRERTAALLHETVAITAALEQASIQAAILKGVTLFPDSVPDLALRSQVDIDFLIRGWDALKAKDVILGLGYQLDAIKGLEWSFTAGTDQAMGIESIYKVRPQRMVELHLLALSENVATPVVDDLLTRAVARRSLGMVLPGLSPADILVQQARHIFKHLCSEQTRAHWVLEYWRHVQTRRGDLYFWRDVESIAKNEPDGPMAVGAVTLLATLLFGRFAPQQLTQWSLAPLSPAVRLWIETYGRRVLLSDFPTSKFYLFLRRELHLEGEMQSRSPWRFLLPFHLWSARVTRGKAGEGLRARLTRYRVELKHAFFRVRFHLRTSLPYEVESRRWQRRMAGKQP